MKHTAYTASLLCFINLGYSQPNWHWLTGSELAQAVQLTVVSSDSQGGSYLSCAYFNAVNFQGQTFTSAGMTDSFLAKLDATGNYVWGIPLAGPFTDYVHDIECTDEGHLYLAGIYSSDTLSLGSYTHQSQGGANLFLAKIDYNGQVNWAVSSDRGFVHEPYVNSDPHGVFVSGSFVDTLVMGTQTFVSNGGADFFCARYDHSGNLQWAAANGGAGDDEIYGASILSNGHLIMSAGIASQTLAVGNFTLTGGGNQINRVVLLCCYNKLGTLEWVSSFPGMIGEGKVSADQTGNFYFGGTFKGPEAAIGNFTVTSAGYDGFLAKFDNTGSLYWLKGLDSSGKTSVTDLESDDWGGVAIVGGFTGSSVTVGGHLLKNDSTTYSSFLCSSMSSGSVTTCQSVGGKYNDYVTSLDLDNQGEILIGGHVNGKSTKVGGLFLTRPASGQFVFVAKTTSPFAGVSEFPARTSHLETFPNPCTQIVNVTSTFNGSVAIYDLSGRCLKTLKKTSRTLVVPLDDLADGCYLIVLDHMHGILRSKFIKE